MRRLGAVRFDWDAEKHERNVAERGLGFDLAALIFEGEVMTAIRASGPAMDRAKIDATTEQDIARHARDDGSEPAAPLRDFTMRRPGGRNPRDRQRKEQLTLRLDAEALAAWRASGPGWQTRIRELLAREAPRTKKRA